MVRPVSTLHAVVVETADVGCRGRVRTLSKDDRADWGESAEREDGDEWDDPRRDMVGKRGRAGGERDVGVECPDELVRREDDGAMVRVMGRR